MWANWVLAPLNLIDRNGAKIQHYRLYLDGGWGPGEFFAWLTSDVIYLFVIIPAAYSSQLLEFAINPGTWLKPIQQAWTTVTNGLFAIISPTVLLAAVLLTALTMIAVRARNADEAVKAMVQRTVASLGMYALILALLYNPAGTLLSVLTGWVGLLGGFDDDAAAVAAATSPHSSEIPAVTDGSHQVGDTVAAGTDSSVLTNFLRPLTWMLNYGSQLSPDCAKQWARMIENGDPMTCLNADQIQASQSVGSAFVMTLAALVPVFIYCRFGVVVIITFATHLGLALVRFAAAAAMAALSPWQDRPLDEFLRFMISAMANLLIASGIVTVARLGPAAAVAIAESVSTSTLVHFAVLVSMYHLLTVLVWGLEKQFGPVRNWLLKAASNATPSGTDSASRWWSLAFPGGLNPQATAFDRMISRARQQGSQWANQTREQVARMANDKLLAAAAMNGQAASPETGSVAAAQGIVPDTAQSRAALAVVNTIDDRALQTLAPRTSATVQSILTRLAPWRQTRALPPAQRQTSTAGAIDHQLNNRTTDEHDSHELTDLLHRPDPLDTSTGTPQSTEEQRNTPQTASQRWRDHLRRDSLEIAGGNNTPQLLETFRNDGAPQGRVSTLTDPRGNSLEPPAAHASPSTYLARITYAQIVLRAMGWEGTIDSRALLPSGTKLFTSGIDETGNWVTEFHG